MSKYHSKKTVVDGITFDSKKEARRWQELKLLEQAGEISDLRRQVPYELIPKQTEKVVRYSTKTGKRLQDGEKTLERAVYYVADMVYTRDGKTIVEDTKGFRTQEYILKRKLMLYRYSIKVREV